MIATTNSTYRSVRPICSADEWRFAGAEGLLARQAEWRYNRDSQGVCKSISVPSRSQAGAYHCVQYVAGTARCTCRDFTQNKARCAHIVAVDLAIDSIKRQSQAA